MEGSGEVPQAYSPPFHRALDIKMRFGDDGTGIAWVDIDPAIHHGATWTHGGLAASLADIASGVAIARALDDPVAQIEGTIELKINFIRKAAEGDLTATARVVHLGKRVAVAEIDVTNRERLCAKAIATFMLRRA